MQQIIYLDNNATTACAPEAVEAMVPFFASQCGNPSSMHQLGRQAHAAVTRARETIANELACDPTELLFTSGATEGNNQIFSSCACCGDKRRKLIVLSIEHKSVLAPAGRLSDAGFDIHQLRVDRNGIAILESLDELLDQNTLLVSVQAANNEIGTLQPIREISDRAHAAGAFIHCDATQLLGKHPIDVNNLGLDFASFSAHKLHGPKGVGVLFIRQGDPLRFISPLLRGGSQEGSLRAGTLNVTGIVGFAAACALAGRNFSSDIKRLTELRDRLEMTLLRSIPETVVNGAPSSRLPGTTNITIPGIPADTLIANTPNVCFSGGSACSDGTVSPSHVLLALGLSREEARCTVRFGVGRYNTAAEIDSACAQILTTIATLNRGPD
jgi:cysteine desulfurase